MKRLSSSDSLGGLMPICPNSTDKHNQGNNPIYMTMMEGLDEEGCAEESGQVAEKKRRLSLDQVKALEKNFEVENKLEPERKVKLAHELGLQPRQVAVWFQNRRARWKTKQLEKDYGLLKTNYDGLKLNYEKLQHDKESLLKEIGELRSKLNEDGNNDTKPSVKEESKLETPLNCMAKCEEGATELNLEDFNGPIFGGVSIFSDLKDGSSDSDSSAIFNEDNNNSSPTAAISSSGVVLQPSPRPFLDIQNASTSSMNASFHFSDSDGPFLGDAHRAYQPQFVKIEEHNFFGEESCSSLIFSDDQAPTLHWYGSDELN